tara:strand:+ start:456 stop:632 length:177 start_codon:yes stop_codon:yes gene_type:complete
MDMEYIQEVQRNGYDYYEVIVREKSIRKLFNIKKWKISEVQRWRDCKIKNYKPPKIHF